jgi:hypothetical protein
MNDEKVGGAVEGDDLAFHVIAESSTKGQDASDRELLAVGSRLRSHRSAFGTMELLERERELAIGQALRQSVPFGLSWAHGPLTVSV